jgi:hypothetical protein
MADMNEHVIGTQVKSVQRALSPFLEWRTQPRPVTAQPVIANFAAAHPQEAPLPGFVEALRRYSAPSVVSLRFLGSWVDFVDAESDACAAGVV